MTEQEAKRGAVAAMIEPKQQKPFGAKKKVSWDPTIPANKDKDDDGRKQNRKTTRILEAMPEYGGMRLAQLEDTIDPAVRNSMEVIRKEQYSTFQTGEGRKFFIGNSLPSPQEKSIQELLAEYSDVFAWKHEDLIGVNPLLGEHSIDLMLGARSIRQRQHRMNPVYLLMVKEELDRLLSAGIIYPVLNSEWVSPIVVVPRKKGPDGKTKIRICQDFRKLNDATLKDFYPLPFLDGYFGYNQIWIKKEDQQKTAFTTEWGIFAFRRMPFGLCNAPGMFQRLMMNVFHDYLRRFLEIFIDDFAVFGKVVDHARYLKLTFQRCREVGLRLHPGKCFFGVNEGILLGHKISKQGIKVDQEKVAIWLAIGFPKTLKEVRAFLGCVGYYRRFIKDYAKKALPLTEMLKRGVEVESNPDRVQAFETLKEALTQAPVLITPLWGNDFHVYVDGSGFCIGVVLSQLDEDGRDHPIYFASRQMSAPEKNYSGTDREALGVIYACKKFRHYLLGYKVIFHTDHNSLKYMVNKPDLTGRIARWMLLLQEFNYEVVVRPGKGHANADFFSRIDGETDSSDVEDTFPDEDVFSVRVGAETWYPEMIRFLTTARLPSEMNAEKGAVFLRQAAPYVLIKGVLHKHGADGRVRRCLEKNEIAMVMEALHESEARGHYAQDITWRKILDAGYWWPTIHRDVFVL
ncbi:unnamed protein product [Calypogeia fissa]